MFSEKGFAMLFSVLVSSLVLSVGLSIFSLTLKELILSSSGRESQFAFYAADSGAECALYWDIKGGLNIFATSTDGRSPSPSAPTCNGATINIVATVDPLLTYKTDDSNSAGMTQFTYNIANPDSPAHPYCANVSVAKVNVAGIISTTIDSRGYNTCDTSDSTRVERGLRVNY